MVKKVFLILFSTFLYLFTMYFLTFANIKTLSNIIKLVLVLTPLVLLLLYFVFGWFKLKVLKKISISLYYLTCIVVIVYYFLYKCNVLETFSSVSSLKQYILSTGGKGVFVYILIQTLQVIFLPIPASIICIVGSLIYGPLLGGLYCSIGVLIGSYVSYVIGKVFGYRLVSWIVGKENTDKYAEILRTRGVFFLAIAFLLPLFPDDILCFIAGLTKISTKKFLLITLITRPIGVIAMSFFGSGYIIPFTGWGIYAWCAILVVAVALIFVVFKWQDKIQEYTINKIFNKFKRKSKSKSS